MRKIKKFLALMITFAIFMSIAPVNAFAAATSIPAAPTLSHNQWGTDVDGNYDIKCNLWYGNNATSYKVYEKFGSNGDYALIQEGKLEDNTPSPQEVIVNIRGKDKVGTYYYYAEFINDFGITKSNEISVIVGSNGNTKIVIDKIDDDGVKAQFTIEQGTFEYALNNSNNKDAKFKVISNNKDVAKAEIVDGNKLKVSGISHGRSGLKIVDEKTGDERQIGVRVKKTNGELPGMPDYLSIGQVSEDREGDLNFWRDIDDDYTNKRTDIRYIYINGGPFTGWRSWTSEDGARAKTYITESLKMGMIPFFVYYNIPDNEESYDTDLKHINDKEYMEAYFKDLKFLLDICIEYGGDETIGMVFEPDFLGYMMQQSGKKPTEISAVVDAAYSSGILEKGKDPEFENNVKGLVEAINYTVNKYYKEAYFGWQFNIWSYSSHEIPNQGLLHKTELIGWDAGREFIKQVAKETADYYYSAGITSYGADFISIDKYGLDGAFETGAADDPEKSKWFWNADIWNNYLLYTETLHNETKLPVVLWQIPVGHINGSESISPYDGEKFNELENKAGYYEDSATTYFFGDTFKGGNDNRTNYFSKNESNDEKIKANGDTITWGSHIEEAKKSGIISILFGAGVGASTDAVGSPPTDDYFWITKAQHYYDNVVMLDKESIDDSNKDLPLEPTIETSEINSSGNYEITIKIPKNSKGTSYKLYENGKTIKVGDIDNNESIIKESMINKPTGTYMYKAEIFNSKGSTSSSIITVYVNNNVTPPVEVPLRPTLEVDNKDNNGDFTITINIPKNSNGETYRLVENDKIIKSGIVGLEEENIVCQFKNKDDGTYKYRVDLINKDGTTSSEEVTVNVNKDDVVEKEIKVEFAITSDWGSGANYSIVITNNSGVDINSWELKFKFDKDIISNSDGILSKEGDYYKITNKPWNGTIKNGEKLTIGGSCEGNSAGMNIYDVTIK
ncbi:cellulose binding domain-containing protein [Clostridium baratii]|uniref:Glycosyl hydrolase, family 18 n=1 Tax=Clostridium baratii TaxID=1561 RepID=A0A174R720_9CLOT|nr:cellulose binding domain-containing protein [Clostridium baratii]CUP81333.1 glycosyl hydrolase%2C family 18 [Clostridium baratii]